MTEPASASPVVSDRVLTIPNALSALRLLLVPVFFVFIVIGADMAALVVIIVSTVSDWADGVIARRFGQITKLGQLLDPAADRLFIVAAVLGLAVRGVVPWWLVVVIVGRDVFLVVLGVVLAQHRFGPLPVHHVGKTATFALFYALPILVLGQAFPAVAAVSDPVGWAFALWGAFLYWWAGLLYLRQARVLIREHPLDSAAASDTLARRRTTDG